MVIATSYSCVDSSGAWITSDLLARQDGLCCTHCCYIDEQCFVGGTRNPANSCLVCDDSGSGGAMAWSYYSGDCDDGNSCTEGDTCANGLCAGSQRPTGEACVHPDPCIVDATCQADGTCQGTPKDCAAMGPGCDGFVCGSEGACIDPTGLRCVNDGGCVAAGVVDPERACLLCDPTASTSQLSQRPVSTLCGAAAQCVEVDGLAQWTPAELCDETGACIHSAAEDCGTYRYCRADGAACMESCVDGGDCTDDATCEAGLCVGSRPVGSVCTSNLQCETRFCVDNYCCGSACDSLCVACAPLLTGLEAGQCGPAVDGSDPHSDCDSDPPSSCGMDGVCDGVGACRLYGARTACGSASCSAFNELVGDHCDGAGNCAANGVVSCTPAVCRNGECDFTCTEDAGCAPGSWCDLTIGSCTDANRPPTAVLTGPAKGISNVSIKLSGLDSFDPDGDPLEFLLTQPVGPVASITSGSPGTFNVQLPTVNDRTVLVFSLTVDDGSLSSAPADLFVEVMAPDVPQWLGCFVCNSSNGSGYGLVVATAWMLVQASRRKRRD